MGFTVLAASVVLLLGVAFPLRTRLRPRVVDGLIGLAAAGVGLGGLLFLEDVGLASWIVAPVFLAVAAIAQVRALFAGEGPFRT